jgi:hypothetical protein
VAKPALATTSCRRASFAQGRGQFMFVFLRRVIRLISLMIFVFSLLEFAIHLNGAVMIQPNLTAISGNRVVISQIRVERSKQQLEESKSGKLPSDNVRLENIEYNVGELSEIAVVIRDSSLDKGRLTRQKEDAQMKGRAG